ncbi:hypothetical protein D3C75_631850 [compost metagenome]
MHIAQGMQDKQRVRGNQRAHQKKINGYIIQDVEPDFPGRAFKKQGDIFHNHVHVPFSPAAALAEPYLHGLRLLLPGDGFGLEFDPVAHHVDAEADFGVLGNGLHIPAAYRLHNAAAHNEVGAGYGAQPEQLPTARLGHPLKGEGLDVDEPGEQAGIPVAGPELADDRAQCRVSRNFRSQNAQGIPFRRIVSVVNGDKLSPALPEADVKGVGFAFTPGFLIRIDYREQPSRVAALHICKQGGAVVRGIVVDDNQLIAVCRIVKRQQRFHRLDDHFALIVGGNHNRNKGVLSLHLGRRTPFGPYVINIPCNN